MPLSISPEQFLLVLGLSFFFGLAFEGFYSARPQKPPGGIRTFPLLALLGAALYMVAPQNGLALAAGVLAVGSWQFAYYRSRVGRPNQDAEGRDASLIVPLCNLLAFLLGPLTLAAPHWLAVAFTVSVVMFLGARERLHEFASRVPGYEVITLGKFLILTGVVLPLLPDEPVTRLTPITPYRGWLALLTVSALSYASYLAQRYLRMRDSAVFAALLGGLYSSTATAIVFARRLRHETDGRALQAGIVLATTAMYLRIGAATWIFNSELAYALSTPLTALAFLGAVAAGAIFWWPRRARTETATEIAASANPLELSTAVFFAVSFVAISIGVAWARSALGTEGLFWLAGVVGLIDIDPFVLSVAQGGAVDFPDPVLAASILVAASSNNLLKAGYALAVSRAHRTVAPGLTLVSLAAAGFAAAVWG